MSFGSADWPTHTYDQAPSRRVDPVVDICDTAVPLLPFSGLLHVSVLFSGGDVRELIKEAVSTGWERAVDLSLTFRRTSMRTGGIHGRRTAPR